MYDDESDDKHCRFNVAPCPNNNNNDNNNNNNSNNMSFLYYFVLIATTRYRIMSLLATRY